LVHAPTASTPRPRREIVRGAVSGELAFPLLAERPADIASVFVLSERGLGRGLLGGGLPPFGPDYETLLTWTGPAKLDAILFAFATTNNITAGGASRPGYRAFAGTAAIVLQDAGDPAMQDIELRELELGVLSGSAQLPAGAELSYYETYYRFPYPNSFVAFPNADVVGTHAAPSAKGFAFDLPKFEDSPATLCIAARVSGTPLLRAERCGVELDADPVELTLQPSPELSAPAANAPLNADTRFAWSEFEGGVHMLELTPHASSSRAPSVRILTAQTTFEAKELPAELLNFRSTSYQATITGVGSFKDLDDAAGPGGLAAPVRSEALFSRSAPITLGVDP